jgi:hypothetical protein
VDDLDMYLTKKYYVKNWEHTPEEEKYSIKIKRGNEAPVPENKIVFIDTEEIYWKNAFAIHSWFVKNIQKGIDDGREYQVPEAKLEELQKIINTILADKSKADKLLPSPDKKYSTSYFEILEFTKKQLIQALSLEDEESEFYYSSSE